MTDMLNPFSDNMQALLAAPAAKLSGMSETFKERMLRMRLRADLSSQQAAAKAIGCTRGTVGMWEAPSSAVDAVGSQYLLGVASAYKVRPGYINSGEGDDGFPWAGESAAEQQSQPMRLDPVILSRTIEGLKTRAARAFVAYTLDDVERDPARFIEAYELFLGMVPRPVPDNMVPHSPQGAIHDKRRDDGPISGATRPEVGKTTGRKS